MKTSIVAAMQHVQHRLGSRDEVCWALVRQAVLLLGISRPATAQQRAARAARMLRDGDAEHVGAQRRAGSAEVDILLGHAHWHAGAPGPARTAWHQALARLLEVDEPRAEEVRGLLLRLRDDNALPALTALLDAPPTAPHTVAAHRGGGADPATWQ